MGLPAPMTCAGGWLQPGTAKFAADLARILRIRFLCFAFWLALIACSDGRATRQGKIRV
jgi:hypothetical protein